MGVVFAGVVDEAIRKIVLETILDLLEPENRVSFDFDYRDDSATNRYAPLLRTDCLIEKIKERLEEMQRPKA